MRILVATTLVVVSAAGCYRSHSRSSDAGPPIDAPIDVQALPEAGRCGAREDAGGSLCTAPTGADLCDDPTCGDCICNEGVCLVPRGEGSATWAPEEPCTGGLLGNRDPELGLWGGGCAAVDSCAERAIRGISGVCHYGDGTAFETGEIPCDACPGQESIVCGPGCAACPPDHECLGPSEASGIGLCLPLTLPFRRFFEFDPCGPTRVGAIACAAGLRCLRWRTPPARDLEPEVAGICMTPERCALLAATRPERFRCE